MSNTRVRESREQQLARYAVLQASFGSTDPRFGGGMLTFFGGGNLVLAVQATTATPNTAMSVVSNAPESDYDPDLAAQIAELAMAKPAAIFRSSKELMDWLDNQ